MANESPFEIIVAPCQVYTAPVGESFPDVDTTPAGNWKLLGTNGNRNISEAGVTITHNSTYQKKRTVGATGPQKVKRTEEDCIISLVLEDLSAEAYAICLNNVTVTDTAAGSGTPGYRKIPLRQGPDVATFALLVRGLISAYGATFYGQYQIPLCYNAGNPKPVFNKSDSAALEFNFEALEDPDAANDQDRFGHFVSQDAAALP